MQDIAEKGQELWTWFRGSATAATPMELYGFFHRLTTLPAYIVYNIEWSRSAFSCDTSTSEIACKHLVTKTSASRRELSVLWIRAWEQN